jgi:hypothetical protein
MLNRTTTMRKFSRQLKPLLFGALLLAGSVSTASAALPSAGPAAANQATARVWFLRPTSGPGGDVWGASPTVYVNGSPIGAIPPNSAFYRDFAPGTYSFSVEPYGTPTGDADTVTLAPGSQNYLNIQWVETWEMGYPSTGKGDQSHSFFVVNMAPQLAQAYLPTLNDLGAR